MASHAQIAPEHGCLSKQRRLKTWSWRKYWFWLDGDQLTYYKDKKFTKPRGLIDMALAHAVRHCVSSTSGFSFEIIMDHRAHVLSASTAEKRDRWMQALHRSVNMSWRRSYTMNRPKCDSISDEECDADDLPEIAADSCFDDSEKNNDHHQNAINRFSNPSRSSFSDEDDYAFWQTLMKEKKRQDRGSVKSTESSSASSNHDDVFLGDNEEIETENNNEQSHFPPIPDLPHPRIELTFRSTFDDIRIFLAKNRDDNETYATRERKKGREGKAIHRLKIFLARLDRDMAEYTEPVYV